MAETGKHEFDSLLLKSGYTKAQPETPTYNVEIPIQILAKSVIREAVHSQHDEKYREGFQVDYRGSTFMANRSSSIHTYFVCGHEKDKPDSKHYYYVEMVETGGKFTLTKKDTYTYESRWMDDDSMGRMKTSAYTQPRKEEDRVYPEIASISRDELMAKINGGQQKMPGISPTLAGAPSQEVIATGR